MFLSKAEAEILDYTAKERNYLSTRISHLFQSDPNKPITIASTNLSTVLASSMKLEYPLNDALPNTDNARDRLLAKIFRFRKEEKDATDVSDQDFELLYAYGKLSFLPFNLYMLLTMLYLALVTGQLSKEITDAGKEIEKLFGVLNEESLRLQ